MNRFTSILTIIFVIAWWIFIILDVTFIFKACIGGEEQRTVYPSTVEIKNKAGKLSQRFELSSLKDTLSFEYWFFDSNGKDSAFKSFDKNKSLFKSIDFCLTETDSVVFTKNYRSDKLSGTSKLVYDLNRRRNWSDSSFDANGRLIYSFTKLDSFYIVVEISYKPDGSVANRRLDTTFFRAY